MLGETGLAVSFPASELNAVALPGSLFKPALLHAAAVSDDLRRALALVESLCAQSGARLVCVARPEIFTHGQSLEWLRAQMGDIGDHLAISDGTTIRAIPGLRNHVFFYRPGRVADAEALSRLERRTPELLFTQVGQINTAYRFRRGRTTFTPDSIAISGFGASSEARPVFLPFYLPPHPIPHGLEQAYGNGGGVQSSRWRADSVTYIPLTEAAYRDRTFMKGVAERIARSFFDAARGVVIRLPAPIETPETLAAWIEPFLQALIATNVLIPQVRAPRAILASADVASRDLLALSPQIDLFAHDSFDFWRHAPEFYGKLRSFQVVARRGRHNPALVAPVIGAICDRDPELLWPRPTELDDAV